LVVESQGAGQTFEVKAISVEVFQKADLDYPLQNKILHPVTLYHALEGLITFIIIFC
jgi:aspartyl/asparaginyl-tRNA synthetase